MIKLKNILLSEMIKINVGIGDTILVGRFKNKPIKVKTIGTDEHGLPTINGRKVVNFRIKNHVNIFDETINKENGKYIVRAKKSGKKLGTHSTKKKALKQLAAIEINKQK